MKQVVLRGLPSKMEKSWDSDQSMHGAGNMDESRLVEAQLLLLERVLEWA